MQDRGSILTFDVVFLSFSFNIVYFEGLKF